MISNPKENSSDLWRAGIFVFLSLKRIGGKYELHLPVILNDQRKKKGTGKLKLKM